MQVKGYQPGQHSRRGHFPSNRPLRPPLLAFEAAPCRSPWRGLGIPLAPGSRSPPGALGDPLACLAVELLEVVRRRRMVRSFTGRPVRPDVLDTILDSARHSPSAGNAQGWATVVLQGPDETGRFWAATTTADWRDRARRWPGLSLAPVIVVVLASPDTYVSRYSEPDKAGSGLGPVGRGEGGPEGWPVPYWFVDGGMVTMLLLLAATSAGLGAGFLGNFRGEAELLSSLGVPDGWRFVGAVLIGEAAPDDPPSASTARGRRPARETIHLGQW
jgi:nitroreductase